MRLDSALISAAIPFLSSRQISLLSPIQIADANRVAGLCRTMSSPAYVRQPQAAAPPAPTRVPARGEDRRGEPDRRRSPTRPSSPSIRVIDPSSVEPRPASLRSPERSPSKNASQPQRIHPGSVAEPRIDPVVEAPSGPAPATADPRRRLALNSAGGHSACPLRPGLRPSPRGAAGRRDTPAM